MCQRSMHFKILTALCLSLVTAPLTATELYEEKRVSRIEIVIEGPGDHRNDPRLVLSRMKTQEGDEFSQLTFDNDLKTLSQDYERVEPSIHLKDGQITITLHLIPKPVIHQIQWSGNQKFKTSTLRKELDIKPNTVFNRQEFNKAFNKVKEYYFKRGYFEAQIAYTIQPIAGTNEVDILIDIQEGRPGHIQKIVLNGFTKKEKDALQEQMFLKRYNFLTSWISGTGTYRDEMLEQDRMTILNYLHNEGYADARVDIHLDEDPVNGRLIIEITADRGQLFHFGTVQFIGNQLLSTEEIKKRSLVIEGGTFSPEKVRETAQAIKDFYGQKGYIDASVQYETQLKENEPIFDIEFIIDEGEQYRVGLIHIFGNTSTNKNVILRESLLVPGETFDSRKLKATQQRLEAVGYFKSVNVYAVRTTEDATLGENYRDVYIEVEEQSTGNISLFSGFSSTDSIFGGLDLTERNFNIAGIGKALTGHLSSLRGGGEFFHVRATVGKEQNNILVSWMNPYVNDTLWRFGVEISSTWSRLQDEVNVMTYGGSIYANYPLSNYWTAGMRERLRHTHDKPHVHSVNKGNPIADAAADAVNDELRQQGLISALSGNISYDSSDSALRPHRGWRSYLETEVAGIGGKYDFFKLSYTNSIYFPVWSKGTLKLRGDFKFLYPFGKTSRAKVPYSERLFLGGEGTVRGYQPFLVGPVVRLPDGVGEIKNTNTPYGGLSSELVSLEYNQYIFRMLDLFVFCDVGSVSSGVFALGKIRPTVGGGARIDIGNRTPIIVGYGIPLVKKDRHDEKWQKVFFSMGGQF